MKLYQILEGFIDMRVANRKKELTHEDVETIRFLGEMSEAQKNEWRRNKLAQYRVGDHVKCVMGAYTGIWIYGTITKITDRYASILTVDNESGVVALPHPISGLQPISFEEFEAARLKRYF